MKIVCIGDSLTYGYRIKRSEVWTGFAEKKLNIKVLNKGISGDSSGGMLTRFYHDVIDNNPSHTLIMGGTNDFIMEVPISIVRSNISAMVHQARAHNIEPIIGIQINLEPEMSEKYWCGITDFNEVKEKIMEYRKWVYQFTENFKVSLIDFNEIFNQHLTEGNTLAYYQDGLHPTEKGNDLMADIFLSWIENRLDESSIFEECS